MTEGAGRWTLSRAGIINVYQYDNEILHFAGGRLLLRGINGSGKSTAMNMLLPFLLDADTRRIDAAGEQSGMLRCIGGRIDPKLGSGEHCRPASEGHRRHGEGVIRRQLP